MRRAERLLMNLAQFEMEASNAESPSSKHPDDRPDSLIDAFELAVRECLEEGRKIIKAERAKKETR